MITIARFSLPIEAQVARAKLDSVGIPAFVADEHMLTANWLYSNAFGGVRLQVPNSCAKKSREILSADYSELLISEKGVDLASCSICGSNDLEHTIQGRRVAFIVFIFLSFPLWPFKRQHKCLNCGEVGVYNT
ncbi:MAG: DUF2007 domain-containing protein [Pseudomonadales bacterium]